MIDIWEQKDQKRDQQKRKPDASGSDKTDNNRGGHQCEKHGDDQMDQPFVLEKLNLSQMIVDGTVPVCIFRRISSICCK